MSNGRSSIRNVFGRRILDSRGRPTVEVDITLADGSMGRASVPSGASTGSFEAHERRDGTPGLFGGLDVSCAVRSVNDEIGAAVNGIDACDQTLLDGRLRDLDGTPNLSRLGANAVLAVSLATARAAAGVTAQTLHAHLSKLAMDAGIRCEPALPLPMINILSGGMHARGGMDVQDFLAVPVGAEDWPAAIDMIWRVRESAAAVLARDNISTLLADEGGLSPGFRNSKRALDTMVEAIVGAGLVPGRDVAIAIDVAATGLWNESTRRYDLRRSGQALDAAQMIEMIAEWIKSYPIVSVEDALHDEDWEGWSELTARLDPIQLVGDDLFVTSAARIARGGTVGAANCVLIKVNQNGTLSGTLEAVRAAQDLEFSTIVSARSGETEDAFIADLAVGLGSGQIKIGSLRTSERMCKYNQLTRLAESVGPKLSANNERIRGAATGVSVR